MLDVGTLDLDELATALADHEAYEHSWLINPQTGEIVLWTMDGGIDGETPVDLDDLDLVSIDPLPSYVCTKTWRTSPSWSVTSRPGVGSPGRSRAGARSADSRTSCTKSARICCRRGTPLGTPAPDGGRSSGCATARSSTMQRRTVLSLTIRTPRCHDVGILDWSIVVQPPSVAAGDRNVSPLRQGGKAIPGVLSVR
jgi:hypothetical protein